MISTPFTVTRLADSAIKNDSNLVDDDTLTFSFDGDSSTILWVEAFLLVSAANTTMDFKWSWDRSTSTISGYHGVLGSTSGTLGGWYAAATSSNPATIASALTGSVSVGTVAGVMGLGIGALMYVGSASGTITLQWAQTTTDAGNLQLLKGSFLRITRLA